MTERPYFTTAEAIGTSPLEFFNLEQQKSRLTIEAGAIDLKDQVKKILSDVPNWLPMASEVYNISANLKDYILIPIVSMPSDLPNRNQQAFPFEELTRWQPEYGMPMFKTWNGMPTHIEHKNNDHTIARGIILDTLFRPIKNTAGDIYKVIKLSAWDRNRDSVLANSLLTKELNSFSMGAYAKNYFCSICGGGLTAGGCEHIEHNRPNFTLWDKSGRKVLAGGKLAQYNVSDAKGFELSVVKSPAFYSAKETNFFTLNDHT